MTCSRIHSAPLRVLGVPSLDQLAVFLTVVETGSFAAAGRRLGRATSAVSYAIANLEQQLGVQLFDRDQARRPALTEAGAAVLSEARSVSVGVDNLRQIDALPAGDAVNWRRVTPRSSATSAYGAGASTAH
jgi:DNA-binding transcriptional LysR family regulator